MYGPIGVSVLNIIMHCVSAGKRRSISETLPSLLHTPAAPLTIASTTTDSALLSEDPLLRKRLADRTAVSVLQNPRQPGLLQPDLLPSGTHLSFSLFIVELHHTALLRLHACVCSGAKVLSLAPLPVDHKTILERVPDTVVTANPIAPLFHRRPVQPVFRGTASVPDVHHKMAMADWSPSGEYVMRHGTGSQTAAGGLRKRNQFLAGGLPKTLPSLPLPPPDIVNDNTVTALRPEATKRKWCSLMLRNFSIPCSCGRYSRLSISLQALALWYSRIH